MNNDWREVNMGDYYRTVHTVNHRGTTVRYEWATNKKSGKEYIYLEYRGRTLSLRFNRDLCEPETWVLERCRATDNELDGPSSKEPRS